MIHLVHQPFINTFNKNCFTCFFHPTLIKKSLRVENFLIKLKETFSHRIWALNQPNFNHAKENKVISDMICFAFRVKSLFPHCRIRFHWGVASSFTCKFQLTKQLPCFLTCMESLYFSQNYLGQRCTLSFPLPPFTSRELCLSC